MFHKRMNTCKLLPTDTGTLNESTYTVLVNCDIVLKGYFYCVNADSWYCWRSCSHWGDCKSTLWSTGVRFTTMCSLYVASVTIESQASTDTCLNGHFFVEKIYGTVVNKVRIDCGKAMAFGWIGLCSAGDISNPKKQKYNLSYYTKLADELIVNGAHVLCIKVGSSA